MVLTPDLENLTALTPGVVLLTVNTQEFPELAAQHHVVRVPTIKIIARGVVDDTMLAPTLGDVVASVARCYPRVYDVDASG
jgi:thioredoxin-like negative regulator of GroEL